MSRSKEQFTAVIGDIVNSKKLEDRNLVQQKLYKCLNHINQQYSNYIASNFMITLGDEFQGLLSSAYCLTEIIEYIERAMYPVNVRFGIGIGEITTAINKELPLGADGPAYYRAREMINRIKSTAGKKKTSYTNIMLNSDCETDSLINEIFALCTFIKKKWTQRQREVIYAHIENGDNQLKTAEALGIAQSNVSTNLSAAGYYTYRKALGAVADILSKRG